MNDPDRTPAPEPAPEPAPLNYLTADREAFLAVLAALIAGDEIPPLVMRVLENHLGLGWAREFSFARSPEERESLIVRRLLLHRPVRAARAKLERAAAVVGDRIGDRVDTVTSHEDGGAR
jgi:hypothetical protein